MLATLTLVRRAPLAISHRSTTPGIVSVAAAASTALSSVARAGYTSRRMSDPPPPDDDPAAPDDRTVRLQPEERLAGNGERGSHEPPTIVERVDPETMLDQALAPTRVAGGGDDRPAARPQLEADFGPYQLGALAASDEREGTRHLARDVSLGRDVVLWLPPPELLADSARRERLRRDARALARSTHPHLVAIYAIETDADGRLALALEQVRGEPIDALVERGELAADDSRWPRLIGQAALALDAAAALGVHHGDLRADDLLLCDGETLKIDCFPLGGEPSDAADPALADRRALGEALLPLAGAKPAVRAVLERLASPRSLDTEALLQQMEPLLPGTTVRVELPQRLGAVAFDWVTLQVVGVVVALPMLGFEMQPGLTLLDLHGALIAYYVLMIGYVVLCERRWGSTLGMMAFRAEVERTGGGRPGWLSTIGRAMLSWVPISIGLEQILVLASNLNHQDPALAGAIASGTIVLVVVDLVLMNASGKRALHDRLTGTHVVRRTPERLPRNTPPTPQQDATRELDPERLAKARASGERIGRAVVVDALGEGGMGQVYLGYDEGLERQVAIKVLGEELGGDAEFEDRFHREARLLADLSHHNVVQLYGYGVDRDRPYFSMELVHGDNLTQLLDRRGPLSEREAIELMLQACQGLAAANHREIVHRDIKPSNMILTGSGVLKVVDFGMAKGGEVGSSTETGVVMGTPHYMSPEQGQGEDTDHRSDIYSLGASFYHLLTGAYPYTAKTPMGVVVKHITEPFPAGRLERVASPGMTKLIARMMAKKADDRPADYASLMAELRKLLPRERVPARLSSRFAAALIDGAATLTGLLVLVPLALLVAWLTQSWLGPEDSRRLVVEGLLPLWLALLLSPALFALRGLWLRGQTAGMRALGIGLRQPDGELPSRLARLVAWVLSMQGLTAIVILLSALSPPAGVVGVGWLLILLRWLAGLLLAWTTRRGLSDRLSGSRLIYVD